MKKKKLAVGVLMIAMSSIMLMGCSNSSYYDEACTSVNSMTTKSMGIESSALSSSDFEIVEEVEDNALTDSDIELTEDKLVYYANLTIETLDYEESIKAIKDRISEYGGIIEEEYEYDRDTYWYIDDCESGGTKSNSISIRIPADNYNAFLDSAESIGKTTSFSTRVENITKQYNDVSVQLKALEMEEDKLLDMMGQATEISDMIAIEERLSDVQTQLNQAKTEMSRLDTDVAYSYVSITVKEVKQYSEAPDSFAERLKDNFGDSWKNFKNFVESAVLFIVLCLPFVIAIVLIVCIYKFIIKRIADKYDIHPCKRRTFRKEQKKIALIKKAIEEYEKQSKE